MIVERAPAEEQELDEFLSRPSGAVIDALRRLDGDLVVLGVSGKMGPTLACMARRALDAAGSQRRVTGVARFSDATAEQRLRDGGVEAVRCDLLDRDTVARLPDAPNVVFMAGQKFGTTGAPERTWAMNTLVPAVAAERYAGARFVAFSTGCVYPDVPVASGGSREEDPLEPLGEYANSCVGRERILEYCSRRDRTPMVLIRLNYAVDLRYGVLVDIARRVLSGEPIDLTTGFANVIWQGDACAMALRALEHAAVPPLPLNVTGPETVSVREAALRLGEVMGRKPVFVGTESRTALLSNACRAHSLFGPPVVLLDRMIAWVAEWMMRGGRLLDKPTHFETRDGRF